MTRYVIGDLSTGRRILDLPVMTGPWSDDLDTAETIQVKVDMQDPDVQALHLDNAATVCKAFLAVVEGDTVMAAGPIWTFNYDRDSLTLDLSAKGLASYYDHRLILPLLAATVGLDQWTVPDPSDPQGEKTMPNPDLATVYTGTWLGTIAKKLVQQAHSWTGGSLPVVFQSDETDSDIEHERTYQGTDFKPVGEAIDDLMKVIGGPEINFAPRFTADKLGIEWVMQVGTVDQPLLFSQTHVSWDVTVDQSPVLNLTVSRDGSKMGSRAWMSGGTQSDDVLIARAYDSTLVDLGFPLMDLLDTSHTSVAVQGTLDGYAAQNVILGRSASETWSFSVASFPTDEDGGFAGPQLDAWNVGDFCDLTFCKYDPDTGRGDPMFTAGGTVPLRIVGRSADEKGDFVKISCAPILVSA